MTTAMTLAEALNVIKPERSPWSLLVLEVCRDYLKSGDEMPIELRHWLRSYLKNEQGQVKDERGLNMARLAREFDRDAEQTALTGRRSLIKQPIALIACWTGRTPEAVKKMRSLPEFRAIKALVARTPGVNIGGIVRTIAEKNIATIKKGKIRG